MSTATELLDFALWAQQLREDRVEAAFDTPLIRFFDGDWKYRGRLASELSGEVTMPLNDTETIHLMLPIDDDDERGTFLAWWCLEEEARGTRNVHVTIDKSGGRVAGRMTSCTLKRESSTVEVEFAGDYEELKHVHVAASPFLPLSLIQQPKLWFLFGPADYCLKLTLAVNLLRLQATNFNLEFDLLDQSTWWPGLWAQSQIVVMPGSFAGSAAPLTIVTGEIKQSWADVAAPTLEDAELMVVTRRWLTGDPEPFPGGGTAWRSGTLFVDIVDKSGWRSGTSLGGNIVSGLVRTVANVTSNYVEDSYDLVPGWTTGALYQASQFLHTAPSHPYVVYRDGDITGVQNFELTRVAGGACRITAGGQSMPGVNELLEAGIGYGGDVLGDNLSVAGYGVGSLGEILNAFLLPILKDSILAYMSVPLLGRAAQQGWGHYLETAATGVTQAYTPAAIMDLRTRRRETDPDTAFSFTVADASPWLIGDNGVGHWWLGDRAGATTRQLGPRVFVCRCRELGFSWDATTPPMWNAKFGDLRTQRDFFERLVGYISTAMSGLQQIGLVS